MGRDPCRRDGARRSRNPTQLLDFARFSSDELLGQFVAERDVLRERTPSIPVTTNFIMSHEASVDCFSWAPELDLVANDHYVLGALPDPLAHLAFVADLTRGVAGGQPWLLMEHSTSAVNWQPVNRAKAPGEMMRTSLTHVARGADGVAFFQWRAAQAGSEKFHSALVPHAGADTDRFREVAELGGVVGRLSELRGSTVEADVAILFDWPSMWAGNAPSLPSSLVRGQRRRPRLPPGPARARRDVRRRPPQPGPAPLPAGHRADAVPVRRAARAELRGRRNGRRCPRRRHRTSPGSSTSTTTSASVGTRARSATCSACGSRSSSPSGPDEVVELTDGSRATVWSERLTLTAGAGIEVVAAHTAAPLAGVPAITVRRVGPGAAWYVAVALDDGSLSRLLARVTSEAGVEPVCPVTWSGEVDVTRRSGPDGSWLFVLNHGSDDVEVAVDRARPRGRRAGRRDGDRGRRAQRGDQGASLMLARQRLVVVTVDR